MGVSFHVGSAATNPKAFEEGIQGAKTAFQIGQSLGFDMHLLDIGGGFDSSSFLLEGDHSIPAAVNRALELHFPERDNVKIIAEPGRLDQATSQKVHSYPILELNFKLR